MPIVAVSTVGVLVRTRALLQSDHMSGDTTGTPSEIEDLVRQIDRLKDELRVAKQAELALADSESRYRSLFEAMAEGVVLQAHDGSILACNEAAQEILGLTEDQLRGRSSLDPRWRAVRDNGEDYPGQEHPAMVTLRTGEPISRAIMGVHKPDGRLTWISINTQVVPFSDKQPGVVASFTDITDLRFAQEKLERNEALFRLALHAGKAGVWEWHIGRNEITWSDEVYEMFDLPRDEAVSIEVYQSRVFQDDRERLKKAIEVALSDPAAGGHYEVEHRTVPELGRPMRWIHGMGQVVFDDEQKPVLMRGAVMDVTTQKEFEERAQRSGHLESIGRLAGGVAHDFNNVLTAILGAVDEGISSLQNQQDVLAALRTIESAATHASSLTRQLLAFAKRQPLVLESCNLDQLLEDSKRLVKHLLSDRVELSVSLGSGDWLARLDPTQLQQVLLNLAANANDAMKSGGTLRISAQQVRAADARLSPDDGSQDWLLIEVEDTGDGMSEEVRRRAFEPFFTTKEAGTGLGLATSYGIVEQSGGRLECTSTRGEGTKFSIFVPRFVPSEHEPSSALSQGPPSRTVMVVEDQDSILRMMVQGLRRAGFQVVPAASGEEALALLREGQTIDLLLSDVVMPGMSGIELARAARGMLPKVRIVFMSGFAPDPSGLEEFSDFPLLEKPFRISHLAERLAEALGVPGHPL